jgi:outer membrane immunogenic protein
MKKLLLSSVSALALATGAANAAPQTPPVSAWTGFYLGIQGGVAWHNATFAQSISGPFFPAPHSDENKTGGIFGAYTGYNWQIQRVVVGLEGDISWVGAKVTDKPFPGDSADIPWLATLRGRMGFLVVDSTMIYFTGGLAHAKVKNSAEGTLFSVDTTKTRWTLGGGIEHKFSPNWSARVEYRYVDLGSDNVSCCTPTYRGEFSNKLKMGLVGIGYKF